MDGNKRIGTHAMLVFFALNGVELREKELDFIVPMTFISGAHDKNCNVELVKEYCQKIHANSKRVVVLDNHGHSPHIVEPVLVAETIMEVINET